MSRPNTLSNFSKDAPGASQKPISFALMVPYATGTTLFLLLKPKRPTRRYRTVKPRVNPMHKTCVRPYFF